MMLIPTGQRDTYPSRNDEKTMGVVCRLLLPVWRMSGVSRDSIQPIILHVTKPLNLASSAVNHYAGTLFLTEHTPC